MDSHVRQFVVVGVVMFLLASGMAMAAPSQAQGEWYAEYFPNRDLAGGPALTLSLIHI